MITYNEGKEEIVFNSWDDVVKKYPAMWVIFDKVEYEHGRVQSGHIWAILHDEDVIEFRHKNHGKIKMSRRTTETMGIGGYIHGELVDA